MVGMMLVALIPFAVEDSTASPIAAFKCGQIIIVGNEVVTDGVIGRVLDFYPGQPVTRAEILAAESRLRHLGFFEIDKTRQIQPTIKILEGPPGSEYVDVLITVQEKPLNWAVIPLLEGVILAITGDNTLRFRFWNRAINLADQVTPGLSETPLAQLIWNLAQ